MTQSGRIPQTPDMLIIGLGRCGVVALEAARAAGARAIGIDQNNQPDIGALSGCAYNSRVWGIFTDGTVAITGADGTWRCMPRATIVATGAIDIPLPVPGWHLPGSIGAHQASRLPESGIGVVVLRGPHAQSGSLAPDLSPFDILHDERLAEGRPVEILGTHRTEGVRIGETVIATTRVVLDNGLQVENGLARMAGIPSIFSVEAGGDAIMPGTVFAVGGSLISVIGDATGVGSESATLVDDAARTAILLTESLQGSEIPASIPSDRLLPETTDVPLLPPQTTPDTLVCPHEGVTVQQVLNAIARGATTVNDVKRRTRAGMGTCQGRDCVWTIRAMLAEQERAFAVPMTARAPIAGISLGELAALGHS